MLGCVARFSLILLGCPQVVAHLRGATAPSFQIPPRVRSDSKFFLWFTDPHIDPYYGEDAQACKKNTSAWPLGMVGCDPPFALMEETTRVAAEAASKVGGVEFAVFTGDFTRHNQNLMPDPAANVTGIIGHVSDLLAGMNSTGSISVGALGNDDSPRNYELEITTDDLYNGWLRNVGQTFEVARVMSSTLSSAYSYGGYYEEVHGGLVLLTINTIIYSVKHVPRPPTNESLPADPFGQLAWLQRRLESAASERKPVWIIGHIPPGIESYGYNQLWHPEYVVAYREIVGGPVLASAVAAQLFGHVHADEFRLLPGDVGNAGPILLAGALSPIYRNNPAFRMVEYDSKTGRPLNYLVYYRAGLPQTGGENIETGADVDLTWRLGYSAVQTYAPLHSGVEDTGALYSQAFRDLAKGLEQAGDLWNTYAGWYKTQYESDLTYCGVYPQTGNVTMAVREACVAAYICALQVWTQEEYDACRLARAKVPARSSADALPAEAGDEHYEQQRVASWKALHAAATGA